MMAAPLADLSYYNNRSFGGVGADEVNSQRGQDMLTALRAYDPNATFTPVQLGGEGGSGATTYQLQYDPSLLPGSGNPQWDIGGALGGANPVSAGYGSYAGGSSFVPRWGSANDPSQLINPAAVYQSPTYGTITDLRNFKPQGASWLDIVGPLAVGAFGFGAPLLAGALSGGALGGAASSLPWWANAGLNTARQVGSGRINPLSLGLAWAPGAIGSFGVPPEVVQGLRYGATAYNAFGQPGRAPQTEITYDPTQYGKMNQPLPNSAVNPDTKPAATNYPGDAAYYYGLSRNGGG